ncbi:unnamed protein product [Lactuca virosa]|uniref:Uncharacterized protein n=1 Tax=Lactuca virosa TaxID=75947 RepID=A0AAU9NZC5_9ASTR|nr:unnamed protein product [Lactuca virosa]
MISTHLNNTTTTHSQSSSYSADQCSPYRLLLSFPWFANQIRFAKAHESIVLHVTNMPNLKGFFSIIMVMVYLNQLPMLQDWTPSSSSSGTSPRDCILLAACEAHETLPQSHEFPADVFTSCLTTPIKIALRWFCTRSLLHESLDYSLIDGIPGRQTDRKTLLGELKWRSSAFVYYSLDCSHSLSGHTSPIESVTFDSTQVLVAAGGSSGMVKLWELEETKVFRTLNGHRSYYTALQFHSFGCIHTYKGHKRAISTIKFTPDGRWVVSGGLDNVVKIWDLTAGKLLHEGHIKSMDFHPIEFLLATGSSDRTVKFWLSEREVTPGFGNGFQATPKTSTTNQIHKVYGSSDRLHSAHTWHCEILHEL